MRMYVGGNADVAVYKRFLDVDVAMNNEQSAITYHIQSMGPHLCHGHCVVIMLYI